jgi:sortase A
MTFSHSLNLQKLVLPLFLLIALLALAGCGSSSAEAASPSSDAAVVAAAPAAQPAARSTGPARSTEPARSAEPAAKATLPAAQSAAAQPAVAAVAQKVQLTSLETGMPTRLVLPTIKLDTGVTELGWSTTQNKAGQVFSQWDVAQYAAGWHKNSAEPGEGGNVVLSGHNNILGAVFRELDQLKRGDTAVLYVGDQPFTYSIDKVMIVPERNATPEQQLENGQWIQSTDDERLTLVSCWPRDDNSHRIIVVAHPVDGN